MELRSQLMRLLQDEAELEEVVQLVGMDSLSAPDRLKLEAARSIREDFLHQDAFHEVDTYTSLEKQRLMMTLMMDFYRLSTDALQKVVSVDAIMKLDVRERIGRFKYTPDDRIHAEYDAILEQLSAELSAAAEKEDF